MPPEPVPVPKVPDINTTVPPPPTMAASAPSAGSGPLPHALLRAFPAIIQEQGVLKEKNPDTGKIEDAQPVRPDGTPLFQHGDAVLLYFSAHWCPPCKQFTPIIRKVLLGMGDKGGNNLTRVQPFRGAIKLIFVSRDNGIMDWMDYFESDSMGFPSEGWYALDLFHTSISKKGAEIIEQLSQKFCGKGIPSLQLLMNSQEGEVGGGIKNLQIAGGFDGRAAIQQCYEALCKPGGGVSLPPHYLYEQLVGACRGRVRMPVGTKVRVAFVKAKPHLNGQNGVVTGYSNDERYMVEVGKGQDMVAIGLKRVNLIPLIDGSVYNPVDDLRSGYSSDFGDLESVDVEWPVGTPVVIDGLASKPELNGREGRILKGREPGGDPDARYEVVVSGNAKSGEILKLKGDKMWA